MTFQVRKLIPLLMLLALPLLACSWLNFSYDSQPDRTGATPGRDDYSRRGDQRYPPYHGVVEVFRYESEFKGRRYENMGTVTAHSKLEYPDDQTELVFELQRRAADRGANAILILSNDNEKDRKLNRLRARALRMHDTAPGHI